MMDVMMMALLNGKERGADEWKELFKQADPRFKWNGSNRPEGSLLWITEVTWEP